MTSFSFTEQTAAQYMLEELEGRRLVVVKVRTENGWVRMATETNADWYQAFCDEYAAKRKRYPKVRTTIKRCHTINALRQIANDEIDARNQYVERLRPFIESYVQCHLTA